MLQTPLDLYLDAQTDMWLGSLTLPRDAGRFINGDAAEADAAGRLRVAFGLGFGTFGSPKAFAVAFGFLKAGGLASALGAATGASSSDS